MVSLDPTNWTQFILRRGAVYSAYKPGPIIKTLFEKKKTLLVTFNIEAPL